MEKYGRVEGRWRLRLYHCGHGDIMESTSSGSTPAHRNFIESGTWRNGGDEFGGTSWPYR